MKPRYKMAIGMFGLVLASGIVSGTIFYFEGSQAAVYAQVAVILVLIVVGYAWVNRTIRSTGTSRTEFERRKARQLGETFVEVWQLAQQVDSEYAAALTDSEWEKLERHAADLESNGIAFDTETGTFDVSNRNLGSLEEINRLQNEIQDLDSWLLDQVTENVRNRVRTVNTTLEELGSLVGDTTTVDPETVSNPDPESADLTRSWTDIASILEECYQEADQVIEDACGTIQSALTSTGAQDSGVEETISSARTAASERQYDEAVTAVLDARDMAERDATTDFETQREGLDKLLATASRRSFEQHLGPSYNDSLDEYRHELSSYDEAIEITQLQQLEDQARDTCLDIIRELEDELNRAVDTLESSNVPEGWYERPDVVDVTATQNLRGARDLSEFNREFEQTVDRLLRALDEVKPKASVVNGFDRIETKMTDTLRAEGVVTADDLPVSEREEQFLGLYYRKNMESVEFDPDEPSLTAIKGGEAYDVTVTAEFPEGGEEREVTITLEGSTTRTAVCRSPLVAETTFEDIPYGEYTVTIEPATESYSTVERTVTVDGETVVDVTLQELSLQERLCEDVDIDIDDILSTLSARFADQFEEEGYLSTTMSFPVDDEYIPCLLSVWAQRQGYKTTRYQGDVIAYDPTQIRKEIENVIRYNLDEGDSKTYESLRNNFLSAPVSDSTVKTLVRDCSEAETVRLDESGLTKEGS